MTAKEAGIRLAPITALLLLLLGVMAAPHGIAPARAQPQRLVAARSLSANPGRATLIATAVRADDSIGDRDVDGGGARIVTRAGPSRPLPEHVAQAQIAPSHATCSPYRARAPPAA